MPLGASRVEGARPDFESYRYELWKLMIERKWDVDYVGTEEDEASYPSVGGVSFDNDHEGRGGWTSGDILEGISGWLNSVGAPDIVLLSSPGGNDGLAGQSYDQAVENINAIIDIIQGANPNVVIIIEQMAPGNSSIMTETLTSFFERMNQQILTIASEQTTSTSQVVPVDMYSGFNDNLLADDVHYNQAGAEFIAQAYLSALSSFISN